MAVAEGLSYCNYCGAKLNVAKSDSDTNLPEVKAELLVSGMVGLFILGVATIIVLMGVMKAVLGLSVGAILAIASVVFLVMLLIEGVILRLLLSRRRGTDKAGDKVLLKGQATKELDPAPARELAEPVPSVTEYTTRTFDPIYREQTSKMKDRSQ
jgi:hypothetical protein